MRDWWVDGYGSAVFPFITSRCCIGAGRGPKPRLVRWETCGWAGHLIYLFDHRSTLWRCHCVLSLFIKIGPNGLFFPPPRPPQASVLAERNWDQGDLRGHTRRRMNVFLFSCHLIQQVWPARKKIPLSEEKGFYSIFGLAAREMKMIVNKGREGSSTLFRGLSVKHCYSGQQSFFQNVKSFFLKNSASVKWKASMEIKHFFFKQGISTGLIS